MSDSPAVPEVANPTDLTAEPKISPGAAPKPADLVTRDLVVGTGTEAVPAHTVRVHYVGVNYDDGVAFDSSWRRGQPVDFPLNRVIPGFSRGIAGMKEGGRRVIVIPPDMGYGAAGAGPVGPNQTLVFVVDLVSVS